MRAAGALLIKGSDPTSEDGQRLEKSQRELEKVCSLTIEHLRLAGACIVLIRRWKAKSALAAVRGLDLCWLKPAPNPSVSLPEYLVAHL